MKATLYSLLARPGVPKPQTVALYRALNPLEPHRRSGGWAHIHYHLHKQAWVWALHLHQQQARLPTTCTNGAGHACMRVHCSHRTIPSFSPPPPPPLVHKAGKVGGLSARPFFTPQEALLYSMIYLPGNQRRKWQKDGDPRLLWLHPVHWMNLE